MGLLVRRLEDRAYVAAFTTNVVFGDIVRGPGRAAQTQWPRTSASARQSCRTGRPTAASPGGHQARQLGFLIGGAEEGFQGALGRVNDRNATREAMVDFVFGIAGAAADAATGGKLPNITFGPIDLQDTITDAVKDQVHKWVARRSRTPTS